MREARMTVSDLERLLESDENILLQYVSEATSPQSLQARQPTDTEREASGRDWIRRNTDSLRKAICSSLFVRTYLASRRMQDRVMLAAVIADLVSSLITGIGAVAVAVLIVREGLDSYCKAVD
jgi:hypothetical protein